MQRWEAQRLRTEGMLKLDDGDLPGAKDILDQLIGKLTSAAAPLTSELALAHIDRATVERFMNDWDGALSDLSSAVSLAESLPALPKRSLLTNVYLLRAKIYST